MNVVDRVEAAKYTLTGSGLGKAVSKATSHEVIGPKKKHVDYIQHALETDNVSIPDTADMLFERCTNSSWVVVFKALVTFHHLMSNANERFIQYVASRSTTWMLHNFYDKSGIQGYDMSHAIRRYSAYLAEKAYSYRTMGYDFCRIARGKENGVLRNMDVVKLLKALPAIQTQLDALLATEISSNDLTNGVVTAAFMALFKDLIRLFACYNDGIINLLEKFFEMKKNECKTALDIYKKFLARMEKVSEFLKSAEDAGINKGDIPDLTKAPNSLLNALEEHYQSLEKGRSISPPAKQISLPAFNVSQNSGNLSASLGVDDEYLREQRKMLEMFENKKKEDEARKITANQTILTTLMPPSSQTVPTTRMLSQKLSTDFNIDDQQAVISQAQWQVSSKPSNDLLMLSSVSDFSSNSMNTSSFPVFSGNFINPSITYGTSSNIDFNTAFQKNYSVSTPNLMDDILVPEKQGGNQSTVTKDGPDGRLTGDLNKGLERVALSLDGLNINPGTLKANTQKGHQWKPDQPSMKTGGTNYQMSMVSRSTIPSSVYGMASPIGTAVSYQPGMQSVMQPVIQPGLNMPMMQQPTVNPYMHQNVMYSNAMVPNQSGVYRPQMGYVQPMFNTSMMNNDPFK